MRLSRAPPVQDDLVTRHEGRIERLLHHLGHVDTGDHGKTTPNWSSAGQRQVVFVVQRGMGDSDPDVSVHKVIVEELAESGHGAVFGHFVATSKSNTEAAAQASHEQGIEADFVQVRSPQDFAPAIKSLSDATIDGLLIVGSPLTYRDAKDLARLAIEARLPTIFPFLEDAEAGALLTLAPDMKQLFRSCAGYVDKILQGAKAGELPIQQPTDVRLIVNLKTAAALRLAIPSSLLARADGLIE